MVSEAKSYVPEIPWNDSCAGSLLLQYTGYSVAYGANGGCNKSLATEDALDQTVAGSGGPSNCATGNPMEDSDGEITALGSCQGTAKPSWQTGVVGLPSDGVRDIPDVSLFASNGFWNHAYIVCYSDLANSGAACTGAPSGWTGLGGTSVSTPIMAGIQALINQSTGSQQGNPNYVYYKLAATEYGASGNASCYSSNGSGVSTSCIFYDVTRGDNVVVWHWQGLLRLYLDAVRRTLHVDKQSVSGLFDTHRLGFRHRHRHGQCRQSHRQLEQSVAVIGRTEIFRSRPQRGRRYR